MRLMDAALAEIRLVVSDSKFTDKLVKWRNHVGKCTRSMWEPLRRFVWLKFTVAHFWFKSAGKRVGAPGGRFYTESLLAYEADQ